MERKLHTLGIFNGRYIVDATKDYLALKNNPDKRLYYRDMNVIPASNTLQFLYNPVEKSIYAHSTQETFLPEEISLVEIKHPSVIDPLGKFLRDCKPDADMPDECRQVGTVHHKARILPRVDLFDGRIYAGTKHEFFVDVGRMVLVDTLDIQNLILWSDTLDCPKGQRKIEYNVATRNLAGRTEGENEAHWTVAVIDQIRKLDPGGWRYFLNEKRVAKMSNILLKIESDTIRQPRKNKREIRPDSPAGNPHRKTS